MFDLAIYRTGSFNDENHGVLRSYIGDKPTPKSLRLWLLTEADSICCGL